jgi:hypothetical protein
MPTQAGDLGGGKDIHQVEEQLEGRHPMVLAGGANPSQDPAAPLCLMLLNHGQHLLLHGSRPAWSLRIRKAMAGVGRLQWPPHLATEEREDPSSPLRWCLASGLIGPKLS